MYEFFWDGQYLFDYIKLGSYLLLILLTSIVWHELGHMLAFRRMMNKKVKLNLYCDNWSHFGGRIGKQEDYKYMTDEQYTAINISGVILGFVPIIIINFINTTNFPYFFMILPYVTLSWHDIKLLVNKIED